MKDQEMKMEQKNKEKLEVRVIVHEEKGAPEKNLKENDERRIRQMKRWVEAIKEIQTEHLNVSVLIEFD